MADANPAGGADPVPLNVDDAAEAMSGLLEPSQGPTETPDEPPDSANLVEEQEPVAEAEGEEPEAEADAKAATGGDDETWELPDSVSGLAEALEMDTDELMSHLNVDVTVAGETRKVNLKDAAAGFQLEADYRGKTADLAAQRRTFDADRQAGVQALQDRLGQADKMIEALQGQIVSEQPDLERILSDEGSDAYLMAKHKLEERQTALNEGMFLREQESQRLQQEGQQAQSAYVTGEQDKLAQAWPEFTDVDKGAPIRSGLKKYLVDMGYASGELVNLVDHRMVLIARDAMRYRQGQKAAPKLKKRLAAAPKMVKPGMAADTGSRRAGAMKGALNRLRKTGSPADAADAFHELLSRP